MKKSLLLIMIIVCILPKTINASTYEITEKKYSNYGEISITIKDNYKKVTNIYKGDLNKNGKIDLQDIIVLLKKYLGSEEVTNEDIKIGDMDNSGKINLKDIILLLKAYLQGDQTELIKDNYYIENNYGYFQNYNGQISNKEQILNYIYYIINNGNTEGTGQCIEEYTECIPDFLDIVQNSNLLPNINNFVHPYNSFNKIGFTYYETLNKFEVRITHKYTEEEITAIDELVNTKITELIQSEMTDREKIKAVHDYIANNTRYDTVKANNMADETYKSNTAYGVLFQNYGICSGYTDAMAIFMYELNITGYEIGNDEHIWNLVNIDDEWFHLDVTWDDPVTNFGDIIRYDYFLIDYNRLIELDTTSHYFNKEIFTKAY